MATNAAALAILFDIDGTLLWTGGAGLAAMNRAFEEVHGVADGYAGVDFSGRTDSGLYREALLRHGIAVADFAVAMATYEAVFVRHLADTLPQHAGHVLPGVPDVVRILAGLPHVVIGVATGNFRRGADLKLAHYGLAGYLREGGYGSDAEDRATLVAVGARRLGAWRSGGGRLTGVVIVGDSPLDIAAARANGFVAVGVATGWSDVGALSEAGADLVFPDLADVDEAVDVLVAAAARHAER